MLINIQFLRLVAAMLVVFYHTSSHLRSTGADQGIFFQINDAVGFAGVDIFFVISGFLIYGGLLRRPQPYLVFMLRRIRRLYPVFTVMLLMAGLTNICPMVMALRWMGFR